MNSDPLTSVDLLSDGSTLVVGTSQGRVAVYDLRRPSYTVCTQSTYPSAVSRLCFSSNSPSSSKVSRYTDNSLLNCFVIVAFYLLSV